MQFLDLRRSRQSLIPRRDAASAPFEEVKAIIERVRSDGDAALSELTRRFDGADVNTFLVPQNQLEIALGKISPALRTALENAASRIRAVAERQLIESWRMELGGGVVGETVTPVARAGAYVPGGRAAYPSTVLMCCVPAIAAGVEEVVLCVPPAADGSVNEVTLAAAAIAGATEVYSVGGAQAIAALAIGTDQIRKVDVVVGPGNVYVALAKRELAGTVGIDTIAGPSEVAVVADHLADPVVIAWDLIAQAEHGPGGAFVVCSWDEHLLEDVRKAVEKILTDIDTPSHLSSALQEGGVLVLTNGLQHAADAVNAFGPEHLELLIEDAEESLPLFRNAGAVFLGSYSAVAIGDYAGGTNHVLPTGGTARWSSGLRASTFQKTSYFLQHSRESIAEMLPDVEALSSAEGLLNHARAVKARLEDRR